MVLIIPAEQEQLVSNQLANFLSTAKLENALNISGQVPFRTTACKVCGYHRFKTVIMIYLMLTPIGILVEIIVHVTSQC